MLDWLMPVVCAGCGEEIGRGLFCGDCQKMSLYGLNRGLEGIERAWTMAAYPSVMADVLKKAKYGRDRWMGQRLGMMLAEATAETLSGNYAVVVAAPSNWRRRLLRGFSLASLMAQSVSRAVGCKHKRALRLAPGAAQASLGKRQRHKNLRGRLRGVLPVAGSVLLVDDVVTTGCTAQACARELLCMGATSVTLVTLCAVGRPVLEPCSKLLTSSNLPLIESRQRTVLQGSAR